MRLFTTQTLSKCITVRNSEKNWEKFPGIGVLKSSKKTYKGIGILLEGVLEVKSFTRILLNLRVVSHDIFSSSEIFIFEEMLSVAASELYSEAVVRRWSIKKVFLEISQNLQESICARVSILIKLQAWGQQLY